MKISIRTIVGIILSLAFVLGFVIGAIAGNIWIAEPEDEFSNIQNVQEAE